MRHTATTGPQPRWGWRIVDGFPRVARSSQPWAGGRNPVGILRWNYRKAPGFSRVLAKGESESRFNGFGGWSVGFAAKKPLKRLCRCAFPNTRLKPGANEMGIGCKKLRCARDVATMMMNQAKMERNPTALETNPVTLSVFQQTLIAIQVTRLSIPVTRLSIPVTRLSI